MAFLSLLEISQQVELVINPAKSDTCVMLIDLLDKQTTSKRRITGVMADKKDRLEMKNIHFTGQFTPKMKANAVPRLLSSLV